MKTDYFGNWLDTQDHKGLAAKLQVSPATVRNWVYGKTFPHALHMRRIKELTKGRITYAMIIDRVPRKLTNYVVVGK